MLRVTAILCQYLSVAVIGLINVEVGKKAQRELLSKVLTFESSHEYFSHFSCRQTCAALRTNSLRAD